MTRQEHFEEFMKSRYPNISLEYEESGDYYKSDIAFVAYQAWKEAPLRRPCGKGQITKEQLKAMKENDDPATIVDRLNGWYSQTSEPYVVPKIQKEAAREIERLRGELENFKPVAYRFFDTKWGEHSYHSKPHKGRSNEILYACVDKEKPAEAG